MPLRSSAGSRAWDSEVGGDGGSAMISGLTRLAVRTVVARPLRSALSVLGIALGVAVLFASLATSGGIATAVDRTVLDMVGRADLRVSAFRETGLSDATVAAIASTPGVAAIAPEVERRTYLAQRLGQTGPLPQPATVLGIDPASDPAIHDLTLVSGSALARPDEPSAIVTERLAHDDGYSLGSQLTIQGAGAPEEFRVIGILAGDGPLVGAGGRLVVIPIAAARAAFGLDGVTQVDLRLAPGATVAGVTEALGRTLRTEPYVLSSPQEIADSLRSSTADFQEMTALIAAIALFVGAFLIFNTLSMTVGERLRDVALLRAAGATRGQVIRFVLVGAAVLGMAGAIIGLGLGIILAAAMAAQVRAFSGIPVEELRVPIVDAVGSALAGLAVTIAAALEPARRASRIPVIDALRLRTEPASARRAQLRWLVGVFAVVAVVGLATWPATSGTAGTIGLTRSIAVYALLLIATLISPFVLRPLARLAGIPFAIGLGLEERLARGSLARDRSRTALALGALTVGLATVIALGWVAQNARTAATDWLAGVIPGDEVVTSIRPVGLDEGVTTTLAAVPGVERVTPIGTFAVASGGVRLDAAAVVGADLAADGRLTMVSGDRRTALAALDAGGSVVVPASLANRLHLGVGDSIGLATGGAGTAKLRVAGIAAHTIPGGAGEAILVGWSDATSLFGVLGADFFAIRFVPGAPPGTRTALEAAARTLALEPATLAAISGAISDALGRVFGLLDALALVAVLVAALGIVNALTMNVVDRVREIGVLRATGMTRRQVSRMVVVEAGMIGLVGALLGCLTGLAVGALMLVMAGTAPALPEGLPWASIAVAVLLGVAVSMVAAYYPARLAGRISIVRAVQFE